jgi:hypothetical protein
MIGEKRKIFAKSNVSKQETPHLTASPIDVSPFDELDIPNDSPMKEINKKKSKCAQESDVTQRSKGY